MNINFGLDVKPDRRKFSTRLAIAEAAIAAIFWALVMVLLVGPWLGWAK